MTAWKQLAQAHEMEAPQFEFSSGESRTLRLHCWTLGSLNAARDNAVLLLHGTTGSGTQFLEPDTADFLFEQDSRLMLINSLLSCRTRSGMGTPASLAMRQKCFRIMDTSISYEHSILW